MKSFYIISERKKWAHIIMLHVSSINRPIVKCRGPIQSINEHQKEPCKSGTEYQTAEDLAVSFRTNYISTHTTKRTTFTRKVCDPSSKALVKSKYMT